MFKAIKEWWNWRDKSIAIAEAIIALLPEEEWKKMNVCDSGRKIDMREMIMRAAKQTRCRHSFEDALAMAESVLSDAKYEKPINARYIVFQLLDNWLFRQSEDKLKSPYS